MPTREQIEAELQKLPPEQHAAFLAEVERRMGAGAVPTTEPTPTPVLEPGEEEYQQSLSDVRALGDVGKGAAQGLLGAGAGMMRPAEDIRGFVLRKMGLNELADQLDAQREQGKTLVQEALAPADKELTGAHSLGKAVGTMAPYAAVPAGVVPQAVMGAVLAGSQALGEGEDYTGAAEDAALAGAIPAFGKLTSKLAPRLRSAATRAYSSMFGPKTEAIHAGLAKRIEPIVEQLPVGGRTGIQKAATKVTEEVTGPRVGAIYNVETPASFEPVKRGLAKLAEKNVRREPLYVGTELVSPRNLRYPEKHKALTGLIKDMSGAEKAAEATKKPITLQDLFKERTTTAEMAKSRSFELGRKASDLDPKTQALLAKRAGLSAEMHRIAPEGKVADSLHSAWETVKEGTKGKDPGMFPVRWVLSRWFGGIMGTTAGYLATKPAFWSSLGAKGLLKLSQAAKAGDDTAALQILRAGIASYQKDHPEEVEEEK